MNVSIRRACRDDLPGILSVEGKSTPGLRYLGPVFDEFVGDNVGEFSVAEIDGEIVGAAKFTVLPDRTAWLEALRVPPEHQGKGIGKRFYERFFLLAGARNIKVMRMYTNIGNVTSKGLAERFGFTLAGTFRGMSLMLPAELTVTGGERFVRITDGARGAELLSAQRRAHQGFVIMNRTFYEVTPALGAVWAKEGKLFEEPHTGSLLALGARFMPETSLHVAVMGGDKASGLCFARWLAGERRVSKMQYMIPASDTETQAFLAEQGFVPDSYDCIVMERRL
ncbi:MAG TPA: GNAT family N-acetyltransferase [Bacillota bacterium]|nr:GNAT family N-acetyltransferase [Bacillota bacterium]